MLCTATAVSPNTQPSSIAPADRPRSRPAPPTAATTAATASPTVRTAPNTPPSTAASRYSLASELRISRGASERVRNACSARAIVPSPVPVSGNRYATGTSSRQMGVRLSAVPRQRVATRPSIGAHPNQATIPTATATSQTTSPMVRPRSSPRARDHHPTAAVTTPAATTADSPPRDRLSGTLASISPSPASSPTTRGDRIASRASPRARASRPSSASSSR